MGSVIQPLCPNCQHEVSGPHRMYGQQSYSCSHCRRWGPWTKRLRRRRTSNLHPITHTDVVVHTRSPHEPKQTT